MTALVACVVSIWLPGSPFDVSTLQVPWHPSAQNASSPISNSNDQETNNKSIVSAAALFGGIIASRYGENEICWWNKGGREHAIREQGGTTVHFSYL